MSRKHTGCGFVLQTVLLLLVAFLSTNQVLADTPLQVIVEFTQSDPLSGLKVYEFTESGSYTGKNSTTDENGTALFFQENFEPGTYQFRVDYMGQQFWSGLAELPEESLVSVVIEEEAVAVTVTDGAAPMEGMRVYLFSAAGAYLGRYENTDSNGEVSFDLPLDMGVKFRADYLGYQFWSNEAMVSIGLQLNLDILHQPVEITVEGLFQSASEPIVGIRVYLFTATGSYQGQYQETDSNGQVSFDLPEQSYKVRADYLGQQFWSREFTWQDTTVSVPLADAEITVTGSGLPLEGVQVYLFTESGSYLGLYETTDSNGQVSFRIPAGTYKFRADYQGSQYWSVDSILVADQVNPVSISTGGGIFTFTALKEVADPLQGVNCYVFNEADSYLGMSCATDENGQVEFSLSDGRYKFRVDYQGYQFWSEVFQVPDFLSGNLLIPHADIVTTVEGGYQGTYNPLTGIPVYLFTPSGSYLGWNETTDEYGEVVFRLPEQAYKVRADYLSQQFWSGEFTWQDTTVTVPMAVSEITVSSSSGTLEGVKVYVFSGGGSYLGIYGTTGRNGQVLFELPAGNYSFRGDYQDNQFWSGEVTLVADQVNPVEIATGGGNFTFTVLKGETDPLVGVKCYVFTETGSYLGVYGTTDENGQVSFDLATGQFKYRVDYLGYQYWSNVYDVPTTLNDILTIPHQEVIITVEALYGTATPIEGVNVYLFTPSGTYLGQFQVTNVDGQIVLNLPDQPYKVRVDYLGQQFWSDEFQSANTTVTINEGLANIHVHRAGVDIEGVRVYLFSEGGSYLGRYETTDVTGEVEFLLPDRSFKFRVDEGGNQYWSPMIEITASVVNPVEIDLSPTTVTFSADPGTIPVGGTSTLTWSSTNAYACEIQPDIGSVTFNGYIDVSPSETTEYTITATGPPGTATDTVQVVVTAEITVPEDVDFGFAFDEQEGGGGLVGETVRLLNGNMMEVRTDLSFPSPNSSGLSFTATYNSRSTETGILGFGWTHTYSATLDPDFEISGASYVKVLCPTGRAHYFKEETPGNYRGAFNERSHVKEEASDYVWYRLNGSRYGFSTEGTLLWIEDEKANRISVAYDAQDRVATVSDTASGRVLTLSYNANGLLESITGPVTTAVSDGIWVTYGYDANQNLTSVTYADGSGFTYGYTDPEDIHNLTEKRNKANHQLNTWGYDDQDRCATNFSVKGKGVGIQYISDTLVEVTDAYGTVRTYTIEDVGGRKRVTALQGNALAPYSSGTAIRWAYDDSMRLIEVEYAEGTINQYLGYDERGNPGTVKLSFGEPEERIINYTYHPDKNVPLTRKEPSILGSGDKETIWDYDDDYNTTPNEAPTSVVSRIIEKGFTKDGAGSVVSYEYITTFTYNTKGQVLSIDGPLPGTGDTTFFVYDAVAGDLLSITRPIIGASTFSGYDPAGQVGLVTDVNGQSKSFTYNGRGRVIVITNNADGSSNSVVYSNAGLPELRTDEDGVDSSFEYDAVYGRLFKRFDHEGNYIQYSYDSQGNMTEKGYYDLSDTRTNRKRYQYQDPAHNMPGLLFKEINGDDTFSQYGYDLEGNVASVTNPNGNTTYYEYDALNQLKTVTQPGDAITTYSYDAHGNIESVTDAESHVITYEYDDMGKLVSTTSPDTGMVKYVYDGAGNPLSKKDAKDITINYVYDTINRLTNVNFPDAGQNITYSYDAGANGMGRRTGMADESGTISFGYDNRGRLTGKISVTNGITYDLSRNYTPGGRVSSVTYPSGRTINYHRTSCACSVDSITTTYDSHTKTLMENLSYRPFGGAKGMETGAGGTVGSQFDDSGRMTVSNPGAEHERTYTYDNNGNLTSVNAPSTPWYNRIYGYDALNRLTHAEGPWGNMDYTYDHVGNRLTKTEGSVTDPYAYITGTNILDTVTNTETTTYTHDANCNITGIGNKVLIYNQNNRLIRVEENSVVLGEYTCNGLGQRIKKEAGGVTTVFHYDFDGNIIGESDLIGNFDKDYLYRGSSRLALVNVSTGEMYYYCNDRLGTPQILTDSTNTVVWEAEYKPFGEAEVNPNSTVVNNFRFSGQYFDQETGLHYNYHRYYDPVTGRYLTPDPIGQWGGINLFLYSDNNPINLIDPLGLWGFAIDAGGAYGTGFGTEKDSDAGSAGSGFYIGGRDVNNPGKRGGHAEIGAFTYQGVGQTSGAKVGLGVNLTHYYNDANDFFKETNCYKSSTFLFVTFTKFYDECENEAGWALSLFGKGLGFAKEEGAVQGWSSALQ